MTFEHLSQEELKHLSQEEVYNFLHLLIDRNLEVGMKLEPFYNLFKSLIDARKKVSKLEHQSKLVSPDEHELQSLREEVRFLKSIDSPEAIQQEYIGNLEEAQAVLFAAEQALVDTGHSSNISMSDTIHEMAAQIDAQDTIIDTSRANLKTAEFQRDVAQQLIHAMASEIDAQDVIINTYFNDRNIAQRREKELHELTEELSGKLQSEGYALLAADETIEELQEFIKSAGITVDFFTSVMQNYEIWSKTYERELQIFLDKLKSLSGTEDHQAKIS